MYTEQLTQEIGIAAAVNPQTINNTNKTTGSVDLSQFKRAFFVVEFGAMTAGCSIALQLVEDTAANLGTATNLAGTNANQTGITNASANKQITFEVRADQITKRYVGLKVTESGVQNVTVSVVAIGMDSIHKPGSSQNDASVATQNVVS
ncbi:MAG TPA: hypothetical protein VGY66_05590 [Gemmataceae bacterium]|jgi:hypothetical protein|nr:hypothetical protein [Gemmataceae bacterium]